MNKHRIYLFIEKWFLVQEGCHDKNTKELFTRLLLWIQGYTK